MASTFLNLLLLVVVGMFSSVCSLPPRISFLLNSTHRPLVHFKLPDVHNTTTLLLSDDSSTLYVGARDAILSLDVSQVDAVVLKRKVTWRPTAGDMKECEDKGKNPQVDCPNFVRVLQFLNSSHLYACGSFSFSPRDVVIDADSFSVVQLDKASGRCPFSPFQRNTAIAIDGELFTATTSDFRGVKPQISRHFSKHGPDVSQDSSVNLLDEPTFVGSSLDAAERKLYFFFNEVGKEFSFMDELRVARVAQVCKDDVGGQRTLQKKWTSFAKAPLLCRSPRQLPFNILQDVFSLPPPEGGDASDTLFYGVFTSQWSVGQQSAVCVFTLQDVRTAFAGRYRTLEMQTHQCNHVMGTHPFLGKCGLDAASDAELFEVKRSFLSSTEVKPATDAPLVVSSQHQFSRVAAMRTMAANGKWFTVLFLLTESGFVHKVVLLDQGPRVIEEIQVFTQPQLVKSIVLSSTKGVLYIGMSEGVTSVPVADCSVYTSCSRCVLARDPLCGWSLSSSACVRLDDRPELLAQDVENGNVEKECPPQTSTSVDTVHVELNDVVRLRCVKPSNMATLTWTSPQFKDLPEKLFIQSADGSLLFHAAAATFGSYHCEAEESGYSEVVASFTVQPPASPRSTSSHDDDRHVSGGEYEEIVSEEPQTTKTRPSGGPEGEGQKNETSSTNPRPGSEPRVQGDGSNVTVTSIGDAWSSSSEEEPLNAPGGEKSYYDELVVVSLLLGLCVCVLALGCALVWRRKNVGLRQKRLLGADSGPELKVEE